MHLNNEIAAILVHLNNEIAAILVYLNNEMTAILVHQNNKTEDILVLQKILWRLNYFTSTIISFVPRKLPSCYPPV